MLETNTDYVRSGFASWLRRSVFRSTFRLITARHIESPGGCKIMADKVQSYANHGRFHPPFHFFLAPISIINVIVAIVYLVRRPGFITAWILVMAIMLFVLLVLVRNNPMKVQDRVIRLEERLRLAALLPEPLRARINELSVDQLVGLRFASDGELPALVERTLRENLNRKQIKQAIVSWRADDWRV